MPRRGFAPEQIVAQLGQIEVLADQDTDRESSGMKLPLSVTDSGAFLSSVKQPLMKSSAFWIDSSATKGVRN